MSQDSVPIQSRINRGLAEQFAIITEYNGISQAEQLRRLIQEYVESVDIAEIEAHIRSEAEQRIRRLRG